MTCTEELLHGTIVAGRAIANVRQTWEEGDHESHLGACLDCLNLQDRF